MNVYKRHLSRAIVDALTDTPVILISGARQAGKSTLCLELLDDGSFEGKMVTLDDTTTLNAAELNPQAFIENLGSHLIIDEIQRAPQLLLAIKKVVDQDRKGRRIILTGSANVFTVPRVADSLAGRMEILNIWPLSQDEIHGTQSTFLSELIAPQTEFNIAKTDSKNIVQRMLIGGYPEALIRKSHARRSRWFESYLTSIIQKDIRDLSNIEGLTQIPQILQLLASRISSTINMSDISRLSGVKNTTLQRYLSLLEHIFLLIRIPAWTPNAEGPFVKSPKFYLNDTGLLSHLRGDDADSLSSFRTDLGPLLENFIVLEILKQLSWSELNLKLFHFSMHKGSEVDLVLVNKRSQIYGIEVKAARSLNKNDFDGLKRLAELSGKKFQKGIVLYTGDQVIPFGEMMYAVPVGAVWGESHK